jgi:hypothetical protein
MLTKRCFWIGGVRAAGLMVATALVGLCGCHTAGARPGSAAMAPTVSAAPVKEIHVDGSCRVRQDQPGAAPVYEPNSLVCRLEAVNTSEHMEQGARAHKDMSTLSRVTVAEQEYLLANVTAAPVVFVVEQPVAEGWQVDSDPPPTKIVGETAIFRVSAEQGQIIRLHVGLRHAVPMTGTLRDDPELGK